MKKLIEKLTEPRIQIQAYQYDVDIEFDGKIDDIISKLEKMKETYGDDIVFNFNTNYDGTVDISFSHTRMETDVEYFRRVDLVGYNKYLDGQTTAARKRVCRVVMLRELKQLEQLKAKYEGKL